MTAEFTIQFDSTEEFLRLIQTLKESGVKHFTFKPILRQPKQPKLLKKQWAFGVGNLAGRLDHINIRDYAYED